jgi:hypothetical protein
MFPKTTFREIVNYISYLGNVLQANISAQGSNDILSIPQNIRNNPVKNLYIVTDRCVSDMIESTVNDTSRPNNLKDYAS